MRATSLNCLRPNLRCRHRQAWLLPKETRRLSSYLCDASYRFCVRDALPVTVMMWIQEKVVLIFVRCRRLLGAVTAKNRALFQCILIAVQSTWQSLVTTMRFLQCHRKSQRVSRVKRLAGYMIGLPAVLNGHRKKIRLKFVPNTKLNGHKKMEFVSERREDSRIVGRIETMILKAFGRISHFRKLLFPILMRVRLMVFFKRRFRKVFKLRRLLLVVISSVGQPLISPVYRRHQKKRRTSSMIRVRTKRRFVMSLSGCLLRHTTVSVWRSTGWMSFAMPIPLGLQMILNAGMHGDIVIMSFEPFRTIKRTINLSGSR